MPALFIDTQKLKKNIQITKSCAGQAHIIGVIKGNGYGLGLYTYAHILIQSGIEILAVTEIGDAVTLCDALEQENVFVGYRHIAASCALLRYPETRLDAVRIGSAFLGRIPIKDQWGYQPIGRLEAPISDIHTLPAGHNIGYGQTFTTRRKTTVAVVPAGYSHGLGTKRNNDCPDILLVSPKRLYRT